MAIEIKSGVDTNLATVDSNKALRIATSDTSANNGILAMTSRSDDGSFTGSVYDVAPETDDDYRLRVAQDSILFAEPFSGAALNSALWTSTVTTFTTAVSGSYLQLNSGNSAAANGVARVTSYRTFPMRGQFPICLDIPFQVAASSVGITNTTWEIGFFIAATTAAPTDGVFLRMNAAGELRVVSNFGGAETQSAAINYSSLLTVNADKQMLLVIAADHVDLWIDNALIVQLNQAAGVPAFCQSQSLPLSIRVYNAASVPASATQIKIGPTVVSVGGEANALTGREANTLAGAGGYQGFSGGTMGSTANWANSAAPAAATLSNTAAGYTTLGGQFSFAAPAGAETDFALFGYQVPAAAAGSHNRNLRIDGVWVDATNIGAAVATTATVLQWGIAVGSSAVSLATTDAATTRAPRRIAIGMQSWIVGAAIGVAAERQSIQFRNPLICEPGSFVHVFLKIPVGTATASQVIRGVVGVDAAWV